MLSHRLQLPFLLILLTGTLFLSFFILSPFLAPLALAAVLAVVLQPLYRTILRRLGNREAVAAWSTVILSFVCILIPLVLIGTQIFHESAQMYNALIQGDSRQNVVVTVIQSVGQTSESFLPGSGNFFTNLSENLDVYIKQGLAWLIDHLGTALTRVSGLLLDLFIFFISLYYLLKDGPKLKHAIIKLSPLDDKDDKVIFERLELAVNSVIKGNLMIALIQGVLTTVGFSIFGISNSVLWGAVTFIAAMVPGIGTALVLLPGIMYLFITGNTFSAVGLLLWGILAVGLIDNMLGPKLLGRNMQLHPLFVLLSVLGGIAFFGPVGIFLGPLCISLMFAFITIYSYLSNSEPFAKQ